MNSLEYFNQYIKIGLRVIPLYEKSKIPIGNAWNYRWDEYYCREIFKKNPGLNMGLLLGEFVDVEGDTEDANDLLKELIGDIPHPMYKSSKSIHHIFINPDPKLTATRFHGMEFRANKHQSVIPPSIHSDGTPYLWVRGTNFNIPPMPMALHEYYFKFRGVKKTFRKRRLSKGIRPGRTRTICNICGKGIFIHKKRLVLEMHVFQLYKELWQCHKCRNIDIRNDCRQIKSLIS